jgi:hypothetical protein
MLSSIIYEIQAGDWVGNPCGVEYQNQNVLLFFE